MKKDVDIDFKKKYNALLAREAKGRKLIDDENTTMEQREKWLNGKNGYMDICEQLSKMMREYDRLTGVSMSNELALNGFKGV